MGKCYYKYYLPNNYYKISNKQIGKIKGYYKIPNIYSCDELFFDTEYNEISNDSEEKRSITELEIISKEEFIRLFDEMFIMVKEKF